MAKPNPGGSTPPSVAKAATQTVMLRKDAPLLIGVFGPEDALQALVRYPGGRIAKLKNGALLDGDRIVSIDAEGMTLMSRSGTERLTLP